MYAATSLSIWPSGPGPRRTRGAPRGGFLQVAGAGVLLPRIRGCRRAPPPTSGPGLDGVGAGSIGHSRLGPTFLGNKIIPGALWGEAPQSWGWWALQARRLLGRKQRGSFQATGGSRTRLQGVLRKVGEGAACGIQMQEGVRVEWRRLRLPFCVHPGRWVCTRGRGAGWVRADVPYDQRKCHSHWSLRDGAQGVLSAENRHLLSVRGPLPSS